MSDEQIRMELLRLAAELVPGKGVEETVSAAETLARFVNQPFRPDAQAS